MASPVCDILHSRRKQRQRRQPSAPIPCYRTSNLGSCVEPRLWQHLFQQVWLLLEAPKPATQSLNQKNRKLVELQWSSLLQPVQVLKGLGLRVSLDTWAFIITCFKEQSLHFGLGACTPTSGIGTPAHVGWTQCSRLKRADQQSSSEQSISRSLRYLFCMLEVEKP